MIFAPAMGIACFQVLAGLSFFVAVLSFGAVVKQWILPTGDISIQQMLLISGIFTAGGVGCILAIRLIRRMVSSK
ncbi:MAG: hypothetical protein ACRCWF_11265 [Beijerinckiaceae bacterium]